MKYVVLKFLKEELKINLFISFICLLYFFIYLIAYYVDIMDIGIVVHGPNIVDSGYALRIINFLSEFANVSCRLGGTMGRTAVIDAALEDTIDISKKLVPSDSLSLFADEGIDAIFLLNYGKSSTTGHVFGYKVFHHYMDKNFNEDIPVIQIERPGEVDGSIVIWNLPFKSKDIDVIVDKIKEEFNIIEVSTTLIKEKHFNVKDTDESTDFKSENHHNNSKKISREIHGVSPGENILVNGTVIGKSKSSQLSLVAVDGVIVEIIGGDIKKHGVDKLGKIDLNKAIVKTGLLRRSEVEPRVIKHKYGENQLNIGFIDHAAEDVYALKNMDLIITVGDDTTLLASDILFRFEIPIIGITDGDLDKLVEKGYQSNDSIIFQLEEGNDDILGSKIYKEIFNCKNYFTLNSDSNDLNQIIDELKEEIIEIIKDMNIKYIIK